MAVNECNTCLNNYTLNGSEPSNCFYTSICIDNNCQNCTGPNAGDCIVCIDGYFIDIGACTIC